MKLENLQLTIEAGVATITVNRPQALNSLDRATLCELDGALDRLRDDAGVRVLILTGAGEKAFVAGADIKELAALSALQANAHAAMGQAVFAKLESLGKPSIAAINGFALGGGLELAMACTLRIASSKARMGLPEITLGLIPGFGGTQRLVRLVGQGHALHMILTGQMIDAPRAAQIGLVSQVVESEQLAETAKALAAQLAGYSAVTLRLASETVRHGAEMAFTDALAFEAAQFGVAASTEDAREGMAAFVEKRRPAFQGQ
jgi:enoyl-CoA hydratase